MPHPDIDNATPYPFEPLFVADEEGRPMLVCVVKATFEIARNGAVQKAEEQAPLEVCGVRWNVEPSDPSEPPTYRYEPEVAWQKPATDIVFIGHAYAPQTGTTQLDVGVSVGHASKIARVFGERRWVRAAGAWVMTRPVPFETIPLVYERAFGGWRRTPSGEVSYEPRNPAGVGLAVGTDPKRDTWPLPNIEDPRALIRNPRDRPPPVGFGFVAPHWQPRAALAGTFDEQWKKHRMPLLPRDFDRRFFNAASLGLVAPGYLRGDERVATVGLVPEGRLSFPLPGAPPPALRVGLRSGRDHHRSMMLDTVIIDLDLRRLFLLWRAEVVLSRGPHDVRGLDVRIPATA